MSSKKKIKKEKNKSTIKKIDESQKNKSFPKTAFIAGILAIAITFLCFSSTLDYGFVTWDDDRNIYKNEQITSLNKENFWKNTKDIFSSKVIGNYNPLTIWTFTIEHQVYGMDNIGKWHLTNVLLHLLCVWLIFKISMLLGLSWQGAVFVAILFGIHPMRVESVAWLTERKDVLFGSFYLAALYLFIKGRVMEKKFTFWIILLFALSLLSKIQAVILPISMILVDYLFDKRLTWKSILNKWPYLLMSLAFGLYGIFALSEQGSIGSNSNTYESWQRLFVGSFSYCVYLIKSIVPYKLSPLYPYPPSIPWYFYVSFAIVPAAFYALWKWYSDGREILFFGLAFFSVNVFFLLQILGAGQGFLADRFTYIAYFGLFFIFGWVVDQLLNQYNEKRTLILVGLGLLVSSYGYMTYNQTHVWKDSETLWSHVIKYYKQSTLPYGNRANYLRDQGRYVDALADYSKSISLNPEGYETFNSRARLYFDMAKSQDTLLLALADYNKAIELAPKKGEFYVNRGATYARLGRVDQAIKDLNAGLALKPDHAVGYLNRFVMYNQKGDYVNSLKDVNNYLRLRPYESNMWYEKARITRQMNKGQESIKYYSRAIELNPNEGMYWYERSRTKAYLNDKEGAKTDLRRALGLNYTKIDPQFRQSLDI